MRKLKAEANLFHNYQDEMNTTTGNIIPRSITRDYSFMKSFLHTNSPHVFKDPINEERMGYESKLLKN